ncbi:alginate lyase family protein, partial [Leptospira sp. SA-E8]|uniref:alginate lyase family protein n=1 Tax=Leptospira sp. SA-E8 TaxID=3422259 RepID=UPI003EBDE77E
FNIERPGEGKLNNHYYWAGASVMAVALASDDQPLRELAWRTYRAGIDEIRADGSLPREMTRRQQALHYHNFSLTPLLMMAELARLSGEDWYAYRPERLPQLVELILHALEDPVFARTFFGVEQDRQLMGLCSDEWGWTHFWHEREPRRIAPFL